MRPCILVLVLQSSQWGVVHTCNLFNLKPIKKKLLSLEWFWFLDIDYKNLMVFFTIGFHKNYEVKPTLNLVIIIHG
jgi:hypothetical protein